MTLCPCGSLESYLDCCGAFISHQARPVTPEALMRSRYTAYTQANIDYIIETMKGPAAENFDPNESTSWAKEVSWLGLEVLGTKIDNNQGWVEFIAHYSVNEKKSNIHEISFFELEHGKWFYTHGKMPHNIKNVKQERNALCLCGSHKKYKKCCGKN